MEKLENLVIKIHNYCNFRCKHCMLKDFNSKELKQIPRLLRKTNVRCLSITGGEVLLPNKLTQLNRVLADIESYNINFDYLLISTNGDLIVEENKVVLEYLKMLKEKYKDKLVICLSVTEFHKDYKEINAKKVIKILNKKCNIENIDISSETNGIWDMGQASKKFKKIGLSNKPEIPSPNDLYVNTDGVVSNTFKILEN